MLGSSRFVSSSRVFPALPCLEKRSPALGFDPHENGGSLDSFDRTAVGEGGAAWGRLFVADWTRGPQIGTNAAGADRGTNRGRVADRDLGARGTNRGQPPKPTTFGRRRERGRGVRGSPAFRRGRLCLRRNDEMGRKSDVLRQAQDERGGGSGVRIARFLLSQERRLWAGACGRWAWGDGRGWRGCGDRGRWHAGLRRALGERKRALTRRCAAASPAVVRQAHHERDGDTGRRGDRGLAPLWAGLKRAGLKPAPTVYRGVGRHKACPYGSRGGCGGGVQSSMRAGRQAAMVSTTASGPGRAGTTRTMATSRPAARERKASAAPSAGPK